MQVLFITSTRLGDGVLSTGLLSEIVRRHPDARVTVVCGPIPAPIFQAYPGVTEVIALKKLAYARHWLDLFAKTRGTHWDWIVDLRHIPLLRLLRARKRSLAGGRDPGVHKVVELGRILGGGPYDPRIVLTSDAEAKAASLVPPGGPVLAIGPAAANPSKEWSHARFLALVQRLTAPAGPLPGARLAVLGTAGDRSRLAGLLDALAPLAPLDLMGATDALDVAAVFARVRAFIGNDSGLMHIAAAMGTPTLGLFGPGFPVIYGPWGPHTDYIHRPATPSPAEANDPHWLHFGGQTSALMIDEVYAAARTLLARTQALHAHDAADAAM